jgi:integrase
LFYDEKRKLYIYRVTDGVYENGKPRRLSFSGKTQDAALTKFHEWERKGSFVSLDPDITLSEWADTWFEEYKTKVEESTAAGYEFTLKHIKSGVGHIRVKDVTADHVEQLLTGLARKYSSSQCGKVRAMLGQILRKAEARSLTAKNPVPLADKISYRRLGNKKTPKKDAFTAIEAKLLMKSLPDTRIGHSIRLMLGTGLSTQELLGLSADDISADGSCVSVRRAVKIKKGGGMYIGDVKAEMRERDIFVPPIAIPSTNFLRDNAQGYIIGGKAKDMPMHPSTYRDFYKSAIAQVDGVRVLTPHCCRHTYISHLEDAKTDFAVIQSLAGQSERSSTIQYIHPQSPSIATAVGVINALLSDEPKKRKKNTKSSVPTGVPTDANIANNENQKPTK